ncbi:hypothetical protein ACQ4LE_003867 [Meloidogyne hapla]
MNKSSNSHFISKQKIGIRKETSEVNNCEKISDNKILINDEKKINKINFVNDQTFSDNISNNSLRRTSSLSIENNNESQQQKRKRSNEPSIRKTFSSNKEKQRKSLNTSTTTFISNGKQDFEQCLEQLTKENDVLKSKLEEQIRLNSVIVSNPSLTFSNENNFVCNIPTILNNSINLNNERQNFITTSTPNSLFSSSINHNSLNLSQNLEQKQEKVKKIINSTEFNPPELSFTTESNNINSNILQKSERSAFSVIRAGTLVGNDNKKELSSLSTSIPPLPPIPLEIQSSLNPYISSSISTSSPLFFPFHTNKNQLEFIRLASQLLPFSLFSQNQQQQQQQPIITNNSTNLTTSLTLQQKHFYEQVNEMNKDQQHLLETQINNSFSQPLTLDTSEQQFESVIRKENSNTQYQQDSENKNFNQNELKYEETQEIPLDFSVIKHGIKKHLKPKSVICNPNVTSINEEPSTCCNNILQKAFEQPHPLNKQILENTHPSTELSNPSLVFPERKTVLEITGPPPQSSFSLNSQQSFSSLSTFCCQHNQQQKTNNLSSSIFNPFTNFLLQKQEQKHQYLNGLLETQLNSSENLENSYLTKQGNSKISEEKDKINEEIQQPSSSKQNNSTTTELIIPPPLSSIQSTSSNIRSSSSNSMLGTLLAAPNKCQISPTVPASRTEFFSGLTAFQRTEVKIIEKEQNNQQQSSNFSSSNICKVKNASTSSSSDSEHSGSQHSPTSMHSLHSHISRPSPTSSTFPGASSSTTIGGDSDRTRRGGSFSPSGNSGFSGDDTLAEPLQHPYLLVNNLTENSLRISDNVHQQLLNDGGNCINGEMEGGVASFKVKLKTNEELERYMDRRRRNNEAAKRCRANRRAVFEYRSRRAQLLEAENGELRQEMIKLNNELEQLKSLIASNAVAATQQTPPQQNQRLMHTA